MFTNFAFCFFSFTVCTSGALSTAPNIDIIVERKGGIEFGTGVPLVTQNIILKFFEKEKEREEYDNIIKGYEIKGATAPNATNFNCDFGVEREREEGIEFGTRVRLPTTNGTVLKFCRKESEGLKYGALSPAPATQQESDMIMVYLNVALFATHIDEFEAPQGAFDTFNHAIFPAACVAKKQTRKYFMQLLTIHGVTQTNTKEYTKTMIFDCMLLINLGSSRSSFWVLVVAMRSQHLDTC